MAIGDYSKTTYVNGTTPAINATNLNKSETRLDEIDAGLADGTIVSISTNRRINWTISMIGGI